MRHLKIYTLLFVLMLSLSASAQSSKSKSAKSKSSKSKSAAAKKSAAEIDTIAPLPPGPPPPPPPVTNMKYFVNSYPEFTLLVKSINAIQLNSIFEGEEPVTIFAPVNKTFENVKASRIKNILQPQMRDSLKSILTHMVISGNWPKENLEQKIKEGGGSFSLPTVGGTGRLTFFLDGSAVWVKDARGTSIQLGDPVMNKNGTVYKVNKLLLPGG